MNPNQMNNTDNPGGLHEVFDQQHFQGPARTTSHPPHNMAVFSSTMSSSEPHSSYDAIDPWILYGGNIAAACQATNAVVEVHHRTRDEEKAIEDDEKKRQRANSRLTAWQSRERKRIEFEVLQEREAELKKRNMVLHQENKQLQLIIRSLRSNSIPRNDHVNTLQNRNDLDLLNMQSRLTQHRVLTSSSMPLSRQPSRNFTDLQQQYILPLQHLQSLSTDTTSIALASSNQSFFDPVAGSSRSLSNSGGASDLRFRNIEHNPLTGATSFADMQSSSQGRGGGLALPSGFTNRGNSRISSIPQQAIPDTSSFPMMTMNGGVGNMSSSFLCPNNDMLGPTIFAPLFRGEISQEQPQSAPNTNAAESVVHSSNRHHMFGSTLPFLSGFSGQTTSSSNFSANLTNFLTSTSLAEEKVDVPLFRALGTPTGQPQQQKRKRLASADMGKDGGEEGRISDRRTGEYMRKSRCQHPSTTSINIARGKQRADDDGELPFSQENPLQTTNIEAGGALSSSHSSTNQQDDVNKS